MKVLLVGSGGREHAIAHKLCQSPTLDQLYVAPGNGGTARLPKSENIPIDAEQIEPLVAFARDHAIDLTVVGPEAPLVAGIVDAFQAAGLRIFGPMRAAAQLEGSKAFSKRFMQRWQIPTGQAEIFDDFDEVMRYMRTIDFVPVIKASGLAAGKGVIIPTTVEQAADVARAILLDRRFGEAGATLLVEEKLAGPEVSVLAFCDGRRSILMPTAQDHKRLRDDDRGPNTGGMGAFSPSPLVTPALLAEIERVALQPVLEGMAAEGTPYVGVLYAGLMLTEQGPRVLEYNCRLGDPETQVLLPLLASDLSELLLACTDGALDRVQPRWRKESAVTVVMASEGYPDEYRTGLEIFGVNDAEATGCTVYQAGTRFKDARLITTGGRVLAVTATARTIEHAARRAYNGVKRIRFAGAHYRRDIGLPYKTPPNPKRPTAKGKN
ncbi:phosphoribosylamine--glycine ligase [Caldilinea sp.]|uniref:phosphoribosylamine--glycine ligase n=1 Tax=Caldilinea sp. TaxID=2293560 RepID=UPI002C52AF7B|nr:phosphoribosylamine--glycine ligase [Anaerolineales bacterium]HQY93089.1 phosphoribosylamine--glycine ligase [Caldilinea sp.]